MKIVDNLKKIGTINFILIICSIVLLGSVSVLFGYTFCNNGLIVASSKQSVEEYYLIEADCFEDYDEALQYSKVIQKGGGAGLIRYDNGFKVFLSGYCNKEEAESVFNKLEGVENKKLYTLSLDKFNQVNGFSQNINVVFKNNILAFKYAIESFNKTIIEFDKGEKSELDLKSNCVLILEELQQQIDRFLSNYVKNSTMIRYKSYIYEFYDMVERVISLDSEGLEFSSVIKYQCIACMFKMQDILKLV